MRKVDSQSRAVAVMNEMFDCMYQCSLPSISWYEILDEVDCGVRHSYEDHFLDADECDGIYEEYKARLSLFYAKQLGWMFLNYSPCCNQYKFIERLLDNKVEVKT